MARKRSKNIYQIVSLVTLTTKGNLGQRNQGRLGKNKTPANHIVTTTFILQHHLQNLIIGFGMSSQIHFPTQHSFFPNHYQRQQTYFKPYFNSSNHQSTSLSTGRSNPSATCFACGRIGHWRSNCPYGGHFRR